MNRIKFVTVSLGFTNSRLLMTNSQSVKFLKRFKSGLNFVEFLLWKKKSNGKQVSEESCKITTYFTIHICDVIYKKIL